MVQWWWGDGVPFTAFGKWLEKFGRPLSATTYRHRHVYTWNITLLFDISQAIVIWCYNGMFCYIYSDTGTVPNIDTIDLGDRWSIINSLNMALKLFTQCSLHRITKYWDLETFEPYIIRTASRRSRKVTFGVALESTASAKTSVLSCSLTPIALPLRTRIWDTGYKKAHTHIHS